MSKKIETVARALCAAAGNDPDWNYDPRGLTGKPMIRWMLYETQARAAIDAVALHAEE